MQPTDSASPMFGVFALVGLALTVLVMVSQWKIYVKAGQPGWAALVPFYNIYVLIKIIEKPMWWFLLIFVPLLNFLPYIQLGKKFGKGIGFGIGLILLSFVFFPILAFGDAVYQPAAGADTKEG